MRYENCGPNVREWSERTGNGSSTQDLCQDCGEEIENDPFAFPVELAPYGDDEPVGSEGYFECGGAPEGYTGDMEYSCAVCGVDLGEDDE